MRLGTASSLCGFFALAASSSCDFPNPLSNIHLQHLLPEHLHNCNIVNTNIVTNVNTNQLILPHQSHTPSCDMPPLPLPVLSSPPWRGFTNLPPELRQLIYDALLIDPIRTQSHRVCNLDASGTLTWSHIEVPLPNDDEPTVGSRCAPISSSIIHLDCSDLWSLARVNRLFYNEATPTMCSHAQLEYISGVTDVMHPNPTLLR